MCQRVTLVHLPSPVPCWWVQDQLPADADGRRKWPWFKALKWILHNTYRMFNRCVRARCCMEDHIHTQVLHARWHAQAAPAMFVAC